MSMKNILSSIIVAAAMLAVAGCEQFSTSYQRVDDDEFRLLDFMYEPADAAPGDTVTLMAVFAGKKVNLYDHIKKWEISLDVIIDAYGTTTVIDSVPLENYARRVDTTFSENTQAVAFKIALPEDLIRRSSSIPNIWTDALPSSIAALIPRELSSMTKNEIIDAIELLSEGGNAAAVPPVLKDYLTVMLQLFVAPIRISAKIEESYRLPHTIRSTRTVRYNNKFKDIGIPVNKNPVIDEVYIYKVKGENIASIDNKDGLEIMTYIRNSDGNYPPIEVEKGYSYFISALSDKSLDSAMIITPSGTARTLESHRIYRQFQLRKDQTAGVHHTEYLNISNFNGKITMPKNKKIEDVIFWVTVKDEVFGDSMRPEGSALEEVSVKLVYK
jgi:hypothetical protein